MTDSASREAIARIAREAFAECEACETACPTCAGAGMYYTDEGPGGCDECGGTGVQHAWDEDAAWLRVADAILALLPSGGEGNSSSSTDSEPLRAGADAPSNGGGE